MEREFIVSLLNLVPRILLCRLDLNFPLMTANNTMQDIEQYNTLSKV
jgi:hypothetical protein